MTKVTNSNQKSHIHESMFFREADYLFSYFNFIYVFGLDTVFSSDQSRVTLLSHNITQINDKQVLIVSV